MAVRRSRGDVAMGGDVTPATFGPQPIPLTSAARVTAWFPPPRKVPESAPPVNV